MSYSPLFIQKYLLSSSSVRAYSLGSKTDLKYVLIIKCNKYYMLWNYILPKFCVEVPIPNVAVFGDSSYKREIRVK